MNISRSITARTISLDICLLLVAHGAYSSIHYLVHGIACVFLFCTMALYATISNGRRPCAFPHPVGPGPFRVNAILTTAFIGHVHASFGRLQVSGQSPRSLRACPDSGLTHRCWPCWLADLRVSEVALVFIFCSLDYPCSSFMLWMLSSPDRVRFLLCVHPVLALALPLWIGPP